MWAKPELWKRAVGIVATAHELLLLLLPVALSWAFGGSAPSGNVILWSGLSPISALLVREDDTLNRFKKLFGAFAVLAGFTYVGELAGLELVLDDGRVQTDREWLSTMLRAMSTLGVLGLSLGALALKHAGLLELRLASEDLLCSIMPPAVAQELIQTSLKLSRQMRGIQDDPWADDDSQPSASTPNQTEGASRALPGPATPLRSSSDVAAMGEGPPLSAMGSRGRSSSVRASWERSASAAITKSGGGHVSSVTALDDLSAVPESPAKHTRSVSGGGIDVERSGDSHTTLGSDDGRSLGIVAPHNGDEEGRTEHAPDFQPLNGVRPRMHRSCSIIFIDLVEFSREVRAVHPRDLLRYLDAIFCQIDQMATRWGITKGALSAVLSRDVRARDTDREHAIEEARVGLRASTERARHRAASDERSA